MFSDSGYGRGEIAWLILLLWLPLCLWEKESSSISLLRRRESVRGPEAAYLLGGQMLGRGGSDKTRRWLLETVEYFVAYAGENRLLYDE